MKTDREISKCAVDEFAGVGIVDLVDVGERAIALAREYGALAPAAPLTFVQQAAIAVMQAIIYRAVNGTYGDMAEAAVAHAICLEAALKKGGAA